MYRFSPRQGCVILFTAICLLPGLVARTHATAIGLDFSSLPSAQGWAFGTGGSPVATEAATWSVAGGVLTLNSMAYSTAGAGTSAFYLRSGVVNTTEPIAIVMRARIVAFEGVFTNSFVGGGFAFGFGQGTTEWQMGITPTQIRNINGVILSAAYDNTQFHVYRLEWTPPSTLRYYVDGTLISTNSGGFSLAVNRIYFGDVTGAANSHAEITYYQFLQGGVVATESTTWGKVKALYR